MTILNGTTKESSNRGACTSFQPLGSSVIDYCFVSAGLIPRIADGDFRAVKSPVWSDHAQIHVAVIKPDERLDLLSLERVPRPSPIVFGDPTPLDLLLEATLVAMVSSKEATARLYGPVYEESAPFTAYIGTSAQWACGICGMAWNQQQKESLLRYRRQGLRRKGKYSGHPMCCTRLSNQQKLGRVYFLAVCHLLALFLGGRQ
jgi:hypothetical protein